MKNILNLLLNSKRTILSTMKINFFLTLLLFTNLNLQGQSIKSIEITGAIEVSSNRQEVEFYSSTNQTTNLSNYKEIKITMENTKGMYMVFDDSSNSSDWEVVQGNPKSNSYFKLCKAIQINENACRKTCTVSYYIRHRGSKEGEFSNSISIDLGSKNSCSYNTKTCHNVNLVVTKVAATVYTWIEPSSGTDSSYKISTNWSPTRTTPSASDILVVDLATTSNRNTTIDISNLTESINKFKIFPKNHVTFKCTSNSVWTIGQSSSSVGHDFVVDHLSFYRKTGSGTLDIRVPGNNTARIAGRFTNLTGTTLFSGTGSHYVFGNIYTLGGMLKFKPTSGINTLYFRGINQSINGTTGGLDIDTSVNVTIGAGTSCTLTLNRILPLYSVLTLSNNARLISNTPSSNTQSSFHAWVPFLQFKHFQNVHSKAYGQLAAMGTNASISGGCLFETYNANKRSYRGFGVPLKNGVWLSQFADNITTTGVITSGNKDSFTCDCGNSVHQWSESQQKWVAYESGNTSNKVPQGKGLLVFFRGSIGNGLGDTGAIANEAIVDFKGQIHTGNLTVTLSKTAGTNSTLDGLNWLSNPYPANLNFKALSDANNSSINRKFYVYDAVAKTYNCWDSSINGSAPGRSGAAHYTNNSTEARNKSKIIAAGASFFVQAKSNGASLNFTESMKYPYMHSSTKHFKGVEELIETPCNELKAFLSYQTDTLADSDGFTLYYDLSEENITNDGDEFDMTKFYAGSLGIGTKTTNDQWLSIDRRGKLAKTGQTYTVPLLIKYPTKLAPKDFKINFNMCEDVSQPYKVQLIDKQNKTAIDVQNNKEILFSIGNKDEFTEDRFELLFTAVKTSSIENNWVLNSYSIYPNPTTNKTFNITNDNSNLLNEVTLFDVVGNTVYSKQINEFSGVNSVNLPEHLKSGIYFVVLKGNNHSETKTIILQ